MTASVFAVPVFFIVFRESCEVAVIVSILLAFLKQTLDGPKQDAAVYKRLVREVWFGAALGLLLCLIIGGALIGVFYSIGKDKWANTEYYWEGTFAILAAVVIGIMGAALLRVSKMQDKWRAKLERAMVPKVSTTIHQKGKFKLWCERYAMFVLPFITILREGLEAVIFVAGVSFSTPASSVPLPVFIGLLAGFAVGYILYKAGATSKLQFFLIVSTCLLYLVAAGLFSRGVWYFEAQDWNDIIGGDAAETGSGPGSYDIRRSVWHINFGNPELNGGGGWGIFNAILGWQNSATYGSVISYNMYWIAVILGFCLMRYREVKGHLPFLKPKQKTVPAAFGEIEKKGDSSSDMSESKETKVPVNRTISD